MIFLFYKIRGIKKLRQFLFKTVEVFIMYSSILQFLAGLPLQLTDPHDGSSHLGCED